MIIIEDESIKRTGKTKEPLFLEISSREGIGMVVRRRGTHGMLSLGNEVARISRSSQPIITKPGEYISQ